MTKTSRKKDEKSAEELFCCSLAAELKELLEYERCMAKNELRNVIFKYQMMVLNRQNQVPNYTERQDSCEYLMSGTRHNILTPTFLPHPQLQFGRRNIGRTHSDFKEPTWY